MMQLDITISEFNCKHRFGKDCKQAGNGFGTAPREALTPISTVEPPHQDLCCSTDNILRLQEPTAVFDVTAAMPEM